jgi:nicotinate-nucleotide--dimethylbenzimidazole phosphoribosyltransferase
VARLDQRAIAAAEELNRRLTKPHGALGRLETLGIALAGMSGTCPPPVPAAPLIVVAAADHGVAAAGVTPWPKEVTVQMVQNFLAQGAAINVLAREVGAQVLVVDCGVDADLEPGPGLEVVKVARGTRNLAVEPAMRRDEAEQLLAAGRELARQRAGSGTDLFVTGDMGIGNTTASAALIAALTGRPVGQVTGRGTGIDDRMWAHKVAIIEGALARLPEGEADPLTVLAEVGGFEHCFLAGLIQGAAEVRTPVVLDGVIAVASALVARALDPMVVEFMIAGHRSSEPGARVGLEDLGLVPLLDLDLRLGEGTGGALAVPLVRAAARVLGEMATFDAAGVSEKEA